MQHIRWRTLEFIYTCIISKLSKTKKISRRKWPESIEQATRFNSYNGRVFARRPQIHGAGFAATQQSMGDQFPVVRKVLLTTAGLDNVFGKG